MRSLPAETKQQSDIQALRRARSRRVAERLARINRLRALLRERAIVAPKRRKTLVRQFDTITGTDGDELLPRKRGSSRTCAPDDPGSTRVARHSTRRSLVWRRCRRPPRRLRRPRGSVLSTRQHRWLGWELTELGRGRDLADWRGHIPRQATTGGKPRRLAISMWATGTCVQTSFMVPGPFCPQLASGRAARALGAAAVRPGTEERRRCHPRGEAGGDPLGRACASALLRSCGDRHVRNGPAAVATGSGRRLCRWVVTARRGGPHFLHGKSFILRPPQTPLLVWTTSPAADEGLRLGHRAALTFPGSRPIA